MDVIHYISNFMILMFILKYTHYPVFIRFALVQCDFWLHLSNRPIDNEVRFIPIHC